jgi:hypothetical protein
MGSRCRSGQCPGGPLKLHLNWGLQALCSAKRFSARNRRTFSSRDPERLTLARGHGYIRKHMTFRWRSSELLNMSYVRLVTQEFMYIVLWRWKTTVRCKHHLLPFVMRSPGGTANKPCVAFTKGSTAAETGVVDRVGTALLL